MDTNALINLLDEDDEIAESYVLINEAKTYLNVGHENFHPQIRIKVYKSSAAPQAPYHFEVSHHIHTPEQISPYYPSRTCFETEREAVRSAVSTTTNFLKVAIKAGHEPSNDWLVVNETF